MPENLKIEAPVDAHVLHILRQLPRAAAEHGEDAVIRVGDKTFAVEVKYQPRIGAAQAWQLVRQLREHADSAGIRDTAVFAVTDRTTEAARRIFAENGVAYVDGIGNAHLELPGAYVHVERPYPKRQARRGPGGPQLAGKAGVAAQALMLEPDRQWRVTDLAERAGVSVGLAHAVLDRLAELEIVEGRGGQRITERWLVDPTALFDTWVEENLDRGVRRARVYLLAPRTGDAAAAAASRMRAAGIQHALTGVAAATRLAPFLTAVDNAEFWIETANPLDDVIEVLGADVADRGANITLMQAKDDTPLAFAGADGDDLQLANIFRIYYDARHDPKRGREQADHLRQEVIGW